MKGASQVNVGDQIDVFLENTEDENGLVVLSKKKADRIQIWEDITKAYEDGRVVEGKSVNELRAVYPWILALKRSCQVPRLISSDS